MSDSIPLYTDQDLESSDDALEIDPLEAEELSVADEELESDFGHQGIEIGIGSDGK